MADNPDAAAELVSGFPPASFPTVFADGVLSISNSPAIVKFFLHRYEPNFSGNGQSIPQPFAQVIMPMDAFAASFAFFEAAVALFVKQGHISPERLDEYRKLNSTMAPRRQ